MEAWIQGAVHSFWNEIAALSSGDDLVRVLLRSLFAAALGALLGFQRSQSGKDAGLRTHMLVASSAALFILGPQEAGMTIDGLGRVMQGIAVGMGFIGAGVIFKLTKKGEVRGLTTAAGLWMTAAVGLSTGLGRYLPALFGALLGYFILAVLRRFEEQMGETKNP